MDIHCCLFIESTSSPLDYFPFNNIYLKEELIFDSLVWTRHQMMLGFAHQPEKTAPKRGYGLRQARVLGT